MWSGKTAVALVVNCFLSLINFCYELLWYREVNVGPVAISSGFLRLCGQKTNHPEAGKCGGEMMQSVVE